MAVGRAGTPTTSLTGTYQGTNTSQNPGTRALTKSVATGSLLVATIHAWRYSENNNDNLVDSVSSGSGAYVWTLAKRVQHISPSTYHKHEVTIWYRENAVSGSTTAILTLGGSADTTWNWSWTEYTGAATANSLGPINGAEIQIDDTSATPGSTGTLPSTDMIVVAGIAVRHNSTVDDTAPTNYTKQASYGLTGEGDIISMQTDDRLMTANTAQNPSWSFGAATHGGACAIACFKGATTQRRLKITGIDTAVNSTTGWTIYWWVTDPASGAVSGVRKVTSISAEASGGVIYVTSAQDTVIGSTATGAVSCVAYRPGGSPIKGLVGIVAGTIEDYT